MSPQNPKRATFVLLPTPGRLSGFERPGVIIAKEKILKEGLDAKVYRFPRQPAGVATRSD